MEIDEDKLTYEDRGTLGWSKAAASPSADNYPVMKTKADEEDRRTLGSSKAAAPFQLTIPQSDEDGT